MKKLVFLDGRYKEDLSDVADLSRYISVDADTFSLHFPKNFRSSQPICLQHINKRPGEQRLTQTIIVEENSEVVIVDSYQGESQMEYSNHIETKIDLKPNARMHYYKWQYEGGKALHKATLTAEQAKHSYLGTYHVVMGGDHSHDRLLYSLMGEGSTCESIGFYRSNESQHFQIDSRIHHLSSNTNSRQLYKGIADDQSHAIFNGLVMVDPNIKEICAHQRNDNLLLSPQAQVDTKPELEIYSEDVRCSHGATVGQLEDEALFYLRSRGIEEKAARDLLTEGFANEIFNAFPDRDVVTAMRGVCHE